MPWLSAEPIDASTAALFKAINAPRITSATPPEKPVVIAIVDDGMAIEDSWLQPFLFQHGGETPVNGIDDDGNGLVDDFIGWDFADEDSRVSSPLPGQISHGTQLAHVIVSLARHAWGDAAPDFVRLLPVKILAESQPRIDLDAAYKGIAYASKQGANIILLAWGHPAQTPEQKQILQSAVKNGALIVASAGNAYGLVKQFPAADASVLAVAGTDGAGHKSPRSSYGDFVAISAPTGGLMSGTNGTDGGTSQAAALVAASASQIWATHRPFKSAQVEACLISASTPWTDLPKMQQGRMGAGQLNHALAVQCPLLTQHQKKQQILEKSTEVVVLSGEKRWQLKPYGVYTGTRFFLKKPDKGKHSGELKIHAGSSPKDPIVRSYSLAKMPDVFYVPGHDFYISYQAKKRFGRKQPMHNMPLLEFHHEPVDLSTLYCKGTRIIRKEGDIEDGSGDKPYSPNSNCKWLIEAPKGQRVQVRFSQMDTEPRTDLLYFFGKNSTQKEQLLARFSGQELPPVITSWTNQLLIWFVTNSADENQGWQAEVRFVKDDKQATAR